MNHYIAETGKVYRLKSTGDILGNELYLGKRDSIDNYEQVVPEEVKPASEDVIIEEPAKIE